MLEQHRVTTDTKTIQTAANRNPWAGPLCWHRSPGCTTTRPWSGELSKVHQGQVRVHLSPESSVGRHSWKMWMLKEFVCYKRLRLERLLAYHYCTYRCTLSWLFSKSTVLICHAVPCQCADCFFDLHLASFCTILHLVNFHILSLYVTRIQHTFHIISHTS